MTIPAAHVLYLTVGGPGHSQSVDYGDLRTCAARRVGYAEGCLFCISISQEAWTIE
jgi:hypothetical protein